MLRLLADENFNNDIVRGLVRVQDVGLSGAGDSTVLEWAAQEGRILLTKEVLDADIGRRLHFAEEARQKAGPSSLAASVACLRAAPYSPRPYRPISCARPSTCPCIARLTPPRAEILSVKVTDGGRSRAYRVK